MSLQRSTSRATQVREPPGGTHGQSGPGSLHAELNEWLRSFKITEANMRQANPEARAGDISEETVRLLTGLVTADRLAAPPMKVTSFVKQVRNAHSVGEGVGAWFGFGISSNMPPLHQPLDIIRDWAFLRRWSELQSSGPRAIAVIDDYLATTHNMVDADAVRAHIKQKEVIFNALNGLFGGDVEIRTFSSLVEQHPGEWYHVLREVSEEVNRPANEGHRERLRRVVPAEMKDRDEAVRYGIEEVALTVMLARHGMPVKVGHLGEQDYDKVSIAIGSSRFKLAISAIYLTNPPIFERLREGVESHMEVPRGVSYRVLDPDARLVLEDTPESIAYKLRRSGSNPHVREFWSGVLAELRRDAPAQDGSMLHAELCRLVGDIKRSMTEGRS